MKSIKGSSTFILYLVCISAFFAAMNVNIYSPIIPSIKDSFHVSLSLVDMSVSIFTLIFAIMQIVFGIFVDFKGARFILVPSIFLTVIVSIGCALTQSFTVFILFRCLQAIGTAALPLIAATTIGQLFQGSQRSSAMGTYQTALSVASAIAPLLGGWIGEHYAYSGIFWFLAAVSVVLLIANWIFFPKMTVEEKKPLRINKVLVNYGMVFKNKAGNAIFILNFFIYFIYFSIIVYLPILFTSHFHLKLGIVGLLYLPIALLMIVGNTVFKYGKSRISLNHLLVISSIILACCIVLFAWTQSLSLFSVSLILAFYGIAMGTITPLLTTMITDEYEQQRGSALGMFNFVKYIGMAAGSGISGVFLAEFKPVIVFLAMGLLLVLLNSLLLPLVIRKQAKGTPKEPLRG
ncbi:putative MFS-type transporter YvmA [Pullulanibacillus camelliae]|uniref:Putative MFS-type transporter YvmA n=1 Tax=Pullulanibacillus camelliae TaxID=1707096 RepID=A0A8J2YNT1_9BACL|nr:MFS transporter [Pullulanibacillus camelliae]GGE55804.1 putative MFS-type transporter YvmA [Pullulanibacillus camelliae]